MDIEKVMEKVRKELPPQPCVRLTVEKGEAGIFGSKLGGTPYFPKDMEFPLGRKNAYKDQPLTLLAQLNFEELPHIPDFPEKGILQLFIAGDDLYSMASECWGEPLGAQDNFRVIYHENIIRDESQLLSAEEIPQYTGGGEVLLPFTGQYRLVPAKPDTMDPNAHDFRFEEVFIRCYNELAEEPIKSLWDLGDEVCDELYSPEFPDAVLGGYPVFTQEDPRSCKALGGFDTLLFELNSVYDRENGIDIMWGDSGTGAFFIPRESLKALDMSRVIYNYDCC
ncbi:MAG: DUF1963 domain-containing protein [Ruminococcus sp.]|nr:DUF1963 domain-containing protein [Ruminococcus sp.]